MAEQAGDAKDSLSRPAAPRNGNAVPIWLDAVRHWYLSSLLVALGLSLGLYFLLPGSPAASRDRNALEALTWMDGRWYKEIAVDGYKYDPARQSNVAFFPVYPLLARGVMTLTALRAETALLLVSNLSLLGALAALAVYVRARYPGAPAEIAEWTLLVAVFWPTGCFFRLAYSESTFLLLTVLAMYAMLRRWPLWAIALAVGLATATRPVGIALLVPFAIHIVRRQEAPRQRVAQVGSQDEHPEQIWHRSRSARPLLRLARLSIYLPLACWGLLSFLSFQYCVFADALAAVKVQRYRGTPAPLREKAIALATLDPVRSIYDVDSRAYWSPSGAPGVPWFSLRFANPIYFLTAVVLVAIGVLRRRTVALSLEESSLSIALLLIPYLTRAHEMEMESMGRFSAVVFPAYLVAGWALASLATSVRTGLIALSAFLLGAYSALYAAGYAIF